MGLRTLNGSGSKGMHTAEINGESRGEALQRGAHKAKGEVNEAAPPSPRDKFGEKFGLLTSSPWTGASPSRT